MDGGGQYKYIRYDCSTSSNRGGRYFLDLDDPFRDDPNDVCRTHVDVSLLVVSSDNNKYDGDENDNIDNNSGS